MKKMFVAWVRYNRRSDLLAKHLGASVHFISYGKQGSLLQAPLRYAAQALQTWRVLRRERPDVVLVQDPPIFLVLIAYLYARVHGARYAIDSHSAAFMSPKWRWSLPLQRLLSRQAATTIVTNDHLKGIVEGWGGRVSILGFTHDEYPAGERFALNGRFNVAVVSTGAEDEPMETVFAAARRLPEVSFYVTGNSDRIPRGLLATKPENCLFTGYLPYERYIGLLRGVDVVMDLTDRDHTLLLGAFEAVSLGTPLIVSDWPVLRQYFSRGTVHVANTVEGIYEGVLRAQSEQATLREGIVLLGEELGADWQRRLSELQLVLDDGAVAAEKMGNKRYNE